MSTRFTNRRKVIIIFERNKYGNTRNIQEAHFDTLREFTTARKYCIKIRHRNNNDRL